MAKGNNLNVKFNGDATGVKRASKEARDAVKAFSRTGSDAISSLGNAFGFSGGKVQEYAERISSLTSGFKAVGGEGKSAFSALASSANLAAGAVAAIAVAVGKLAFNQLNIQAKAYESTLEGIVYLEKQRDYRKTYAQAIGEISGLDGSNWTQVKEKVKTLGTTVGATFGQAMINTFLTPVSTFKNDLGSMYNISGMVAMIQEANEKAKTSSEIAGQIKVHLAEQEKHNREIMKLEADIARYRMDASDQSLSQEQRAQAVEKATEAVRQKYSMMIADQRTLGNLMQQHNDVVQSGKEDTDAQADAAAKVYQMEAQMSNEMRMINRLQSSITGATTTQRTEMEKMLDLAEKLTEQQILQNYVSQLTVSEKQIGMQEWSSIGGISGGRASSGDRSLDLSNTNKYNEERLRQWREEQEALQGVNEELNAMLQSMTSDAISTFAEGLGSLVADLMNGENAFENFTNLALSAFGDMAISVGKIAIGTGVAASGIQAALKSLNPYAAIAAGGALVALGAAVKTSLSNVASGNYSSSSVASSSYANSAAASGSMAETMTINVTGKLVGEGSKLVAVLNNEENRRSYTA